MQPLKSSARAVSPGGRRIRAVALFAAGTAIAAGLALFSERSALAVLVLDKIPEITTASKEPGSASGAKTTAPSSAGVKQTYERPLSIPFPADNPYTAPKAHLGQMLFFEPRMSRAKMQSCASCHSPSFAWGDGLAKGVGEHMKELGRRTPTILNGAWGEIFMWDGRKETLEDQALGPIEAGVEMNMPLDELIKRLEAIPAYPKAFEAAFPGDGKITAKNIAKAIATFERTVVSAMAPFDRWIAGDEGAIGDDAKRGFDLFNGKANCAACHKSWRFTDDSFHDIGVPDDDVGRGKFLPEIEKMQHAFKTPGLRNIVERAPYMHDGSLPDLRAVVEHYNRGGVERPSRSDQIFPLKLSDGEIDDIVAFMRTLSSEDRLPRLSALPR